MTQRWRPRRREKKEGKEKHRERHVSRKASRTAPPGLAVWPLSPARRGSAPRRPARPPRRAASRRSQMACEAATVMSPGTTRWNSMNEARPAARVRTSWASMAPLALAAIASLMRRRSRRDRLVHQAAHRVAHQPPAYPYDVQRHRRRQRRVEDVPAGQCRQAEAEQHAERGRDVGQEVPAAGNQRRRPLSPAPDDEERAPGAVEGGGEGVERHALGERGKRARPDERVPGLLQDQQRGNGDKHAFHHGREVLGLVVAELVAPIGGLLRQADGIERYAPRSPD